MFIPFSGVPGGVQQGEHDEHRLPGSHEVWAVRLRHLPRRRHVAGG